MFGCPTPAAGSSKATSANAAASSPGRSGAVVARDRALRFNFAGFGRSARSAPRFTFSGFGRTSSSAAVTMAESFTHGGERTQSRHDSVHGQWSLEQHPRYGKQSREVIVAVLAAAQRPTCHLSRLPLELLFEVFGWTWQGGAAAVPGPFRPLARPVQLCDSTQFDSGFGPSCTLEHLFVPSGVRGVAVFTRAGELVRYIGAGILQNCCGVVVVGDHLFVADGKRELVVDFRVADGVLVGDFDVGMRPLGIAAADGLLFVSSIYECCVRVFREDGTLVQNIGTKHQLHGVAVCENELFVVENARSCVAVFRADSGDLVRRLGRGSLNYPSGVCVRGGFLFVANSRNGCCSVFSMADDSHVADLGGMRTQTTALGVVPDVGKSITSSPCGVCVSDDGVLYVTCDQGIVSFRVFGEGDAEAPPPAVPNVARY